MKINFLSERNSYSKNEIKIGTWINGKSIYRRVIECIVPEYKDTNIYGGVTFYKLSDSVDEIIQEYAVIKSKTQLPKNDYNDVITPVFYHSKTIITVNTIRGENKENSIAIFNLDPDFNGCKGYIIIEYTKI